jgi:hypothetical protein
VVTPTTAAAAVEVQESVSDPSDKHEPVVLLGAANVTRRRSYEYDPAKTPEKSILVVTAGSGSNGEKRNAQQSNGGSSSKRSSPKQRHAHSSNSAGASSRKVRKNISWGGVEELDVDDIDNNDAAVDVQSEAAEIIQVSLYFE